MADDFDAGFSELTDGENRLADLFRQVAFALDGLVEKTRRLGEVFDAIAPAGDLGGLAGGASARAHGATGPPPGFGPSPGALAAGFPNTAAGRGEERPDPENTRANQRTAEAIEEIARNGLKLRDSPSAVYSE